MSNSNEVYEEWMRNNGQLFRVEALHTKLVSNKPDYVELYPYLTAYNETFNQTWNNEDVYGRMDGIPSYLNTKRVVNLTLRVMSANLQQAKENLYLISKLARFTYPAVTKKNNIHNIKAAPILRIKFGNLLRDAKTNGGLFGYIQGALTINPLIEYGWFTPIRAVQNEKAEVVREQSLQARENLVPAGSENTLLYKYVEVSFQFCILHNHVLGQDVEDIEGYRFFQGYFPYSVDKPDYKLAVEDTPMHRHDPLPQQSLPEADQSYVSTEEIMSAMNYTTMELAISERNQKEIMNAKISNSVDKAIKIARDASILDPYAQYRTNIFPKNGIVSFTGKKED